MTTSRLRRNDRYGFVLQGSPPAAAAGVESIHARLSGALSRSSASKAVRRDVHARALRDIPGLAPDEVLVCGLCRLAAMKKLGCKTATVWVRSGISDGLGQLLAEQNDNGLHEPLAHTEQAALYRELKALLTEAASRRQEASRFTGTGDYPRSDGGATVAPPSSLNGKTRKRDAVVVTVRRENAQVARCRHGGGTVEHSPITTMPMAPFAPCGGAKNGQGLPSTKSSPPRSP